MKSLRLDIALMVFSRRYQLTVINFLILFAILPITPAAARPRNLTPELAKDRQVIILSKRRACIQRGHKVHAASISRNKGNVRLTPIRRKENARATRACRAITIRQQEAPIIEQCADLTRDGAVTVSDFNLFLDLWFANSIKADFTLDGRVNSVDTFQYFRAYFHPEYCDGNPPPPTPTASPTPSITPSPTPTDEPLDPDVPQPLEPLSVVPCPGYESVHIYPVSTVSNGPVCPNGSSLVLYISAEDGSDTNSGETPSAPVATLDRAIELGESYRSGSVWMVLRRGEIWSGTALRMNQAKFIRPSGLTAANPTVVTAYGDDLLKRPKLRMNPGVNGLWVYQNYFITISGLQIEAEQGTGGTGITGQDYLDPDDPRYGSHYPHLPRSGTIDVDVDFKVVVEDCEINGFAGNIIFQSVAGPFGWNEFNPANFPTITPHVVVNGRSYIECHRQGLSASEAAICNRDNDFNGNDRTSPILCQNDPDEDCDEFIDTRYILDGIVMRDNIIHDSATAGGSHSQGVYTYQVQNVTFENNIVQRSGWMNDRNGVEPNSRGATIFNHNLYFNSRSGPATIRNNILADASSHGLQARPGGVIEGNLFVRNPLAMFVAKSSLERYVNFRSIVRNNVVEEGNDINASLDRGFGIDHNNARYSEIDGNIIAHLSPTSLRYNNLAFSVNCESSRGYPCQSTLTENIVFNWSNSQGGGLGVSVANSGQMVSSEDTILVAENSFANFGTTDFSMARSTESVAGRVTFHANRYFHPTFPNGAGTPQALFEFPGSGSVLFSAWRSGFEPTAVAQSAHSFPSPCRTVASYFQEMVLEGAPLNCNEIFDDELYFDFMDLARQKSRFVNSDKVQARAVINYIRAGFGKSALP